MLNDQELRWMDMHAHLDKLEEGPEKAIEKALSVGVDRIITIGTDPQDLPVVLELAKKYAPHVYCTLGIHPHDGVSYSKEIGEFILQNAGQDRVVAIGEIGLDYYYNQSPKKEQLEAFRSQLDLARQLKMPVEIHTRDAEEDTVAILSEYKDQVTGLIHCFTGTQWLSDKCLDLGYYISISGVVTFKNAHELKKTVSTIPLDRLLVETDSPFLSPVPMRGKPNTPAHVVHTAKVVAEIKNISLKELCIQTRKNAETIFPKLKTESGVL